jgi:glycosyltransferase involved in cell wall biosynthesis
MNKPLVTIITPTTGTKYLKQALESVKNQTYDNIQHLVVVDGQWPTAQPILSEFPKVDKIQLPYNTGFEQYNGHRIYGAATFLAKGDYLIFLDEDNWFEPNHVEEMVKAVEGPTGWAHTLRKIVNSEGEYICNDDCESLGWWKSILGDNFVDVNCYIVHKSLALGFAPYWYRRARHPDEQPEVDRLLSSKLMAMNSIERPIKSTGQYTVNYRVASRADSVQAEFFLKGNVLMQEMYGVLPWRKI